jgi:hypothetical protein
MRSRVVCTAVAATGMLYAAYIATRACGTDITSHLIEEAAPATAIWGMVVVGFGLFGATFRRRQPQTLFT